VPKKPKVIEEPELREAQSENPIINNNNNNNKLQSVLLLPKETENKQAAVKRQELDKDCS